MSLFFYLISALISLSLPMTIRVSPSVNTCSGPGMGNRFLPWRMARILICLLYTSDAADEL